MPQRSSQPTQPTQASISQFFSKSQRPLKRASSPAIDLTVDSDGDRPAKRVKREEHHASPPQRNPGGSLQPVPESPLKRSFRFIPSESPERRNALPEPNTETIQERQQKEAKRKALKSILTQTFSERLPSHAGSEVEGGPATTEAGSDLSDIEEIKSDLRSKFTAEQRTQTSAKENVKGKHKAGTPPDGSRKGYRGKKKPEVEVGPSGEPYTPLEHQVRRLKEANPGTLLFFEVGYKYRFFGEDARIASKELGIACFTDRNFLTASIPVHRKVVHAKKLLSLGHRVGIVGQTETAALKKAGSNRNAPFTREVTELYTATTFVDELESADDNGGSAFAAPLICLSEELRGGMGADEQVLFGMISVTPSTGDIVYDEFLDSHMRSELETRLSHIKPSELLLSNKLSKATDKMLAHYSRTSMTNTHCGVRIEWIDDIMGYTDAFGYLQMFYGSEDRAFQDSSSKAFSTRNPMADITSLPKQVVIALAHSVRHLAAFGLSDSFRRTTFFTKFLTRSHMLLNANTLTNLEIFQNQTDYKEKGSLAWILDKTQTRFGARYLRGWMGRPLVDKSILQERVDAVEEILEAGSANLAKLRTLLKGLPDLVKGLCRIQYGKTNPQELATILTAFSRVASAFEPFAKPDDVGFKSSLLNDILFAIPKIKEPLKAIVGVIDLRKAREGNLTELWRDEEKYPALDNCKLAIASVESEMEQHLKDVRKQLRRPGLKWASVSGFDYLVEVANADNKNVPTNWTRVSGTKKFTRYHTPEARKNVQERDQHRETLKAEAQNAFQAFQAEFAENYGLLRDVVNKLAMADCLISLAQVASLPGYVKPTFTDGDSVRITQGRHPMVEEIRTDPFVPNDVNLGGEEPKNMVITGPNMGGKSSCVRMIALIAIMAQIGSYVPADTAELCLHDCVLTRMGASDELARGRSTFMVEMSETSDIIQTATDKSLVILDELGRGTATYDGLAIANAVLEHLITQVKCKTLFITHYPQIGKELEAKYPTGVSNAHMGFIEDEKTDGRREVHFLYSLTKGITQNSFGVECARLAGLPDSTLQVAVQRSAYSAEMERLRLRTRRLRNALRAARVLLAMKDGTNQGPGQLRELLDQLKL